MRTCKNCGLEKSQDDYYKGRRICKPCSLKKMKEYRDANKERVQEAQKRWRRENEGHTYLNKQAGYVIYIGFEHPATHPSGFTRLHRIVLWDKLKKAGIDHESIPCHWCNTILTWNQVKTDHLNWQKADNHPENLVPSCHPCNAKRRMPVPKKFCTFEGCKRYVKSVGFCQTHYTQKWKKNKQTPIQRRSDPATRAGIVKDVQAGMTIKGVGKKYNLDYSSVSRIYKRETGHSVADWRRAVKAGTLRG